MSGYWVMIAPAAVAAMAAVVVAARRMAYHPRHQLGAGQLSELAAPDVGSMILADETAALADGTGQPARLGTWVPHADPWGIPEAGEWTGQLLADLRETREGRPPWESAPEPLAAAVAARIAAVLAVVDPRPPEPTRLAHEADPADVLLAADVARHMRAQDASASLYLALLAAWGESYLADLKGQL